ncbi:MAG: hypothetical protein JO115_25135 [Pseudonocardiales bacterium]|nr:hypothetical protein [Pseudonocardiales bacterium]
MTNPGSSQPDGLREAPPRGELRVVVHLLTVDGLLSSERGVHLPRVYGTVCGEEPSSSSRIDPAALQRLAAGSAS